MTEQQEARLPRYARQELELLRMRLREAKKAIIDNTCGPIEGPAIVFDPYGDYHLSQRPDRKVQMTETCENKCSGIFVRMDVDYEGNWYVEVRGERSLTIRPEVANSIRVYLED